MIVVSRKLIAGLIRGEDDAYLAVIKTLKQPVYRFALRLCRDSTMAEDVTQQTFLAIWQSIGSFRWKSKFSTWVFGIAYRQYLLLRRKNRFETLQLVESDQSDRSDLSDLLAESQQKALVRRAVYDLPSTYREVVSLIYLEGFTCSEAAEVLGIPIGTVKSRINSALRILRKTLGESEEHDEQQESPDAIHT